MAVESTHLHICIESLFTFYLDILNRIKDVIALRFRVPWVGGIELFRIVLRTTIDSIKVKYTILYRLTILGG